MWLLKLTRGFHYSALSFLLCDYSNHQLQNSLSFRFCKIIHSLPTSSYTAVNSLSKHSPKISRTGFSVSCFSWTLLLQQRLLLFHFNSNFSFICSSLLFSAFLVSHRFHHTKVSAIEIVSHFLTCLCYIVGVERKLLLSTREICIRTKHLIRLYRRILR